MVFSSILFLLYFFPVFLILYYSVPQRYKNAVALFASVLFFYWGAPLFTFVVVASLILDFFIVKQIAASTKPKRKFIFLLLSLILNIGLLAFFKYANFFVENINALVSNWGAGGIMNWTEVALPIGISFFTFKKLSYTIDVYRNTHAPFSNFFNYALFILLFPELIAGPIVRYNEIADQIIDRKNQETIDNKLSGLFRFIIGLSKKVLIANLLGAEADKVFNTPFHLLNTGDAWIGIIAYTFQIYFDFSGYSDMAIGIAKMLGFTFPENFNYPYVSKSITEFWTRWHMTLGRWMRDYLYIPLGGNRVKSKFRLYFNLSFVFFISGLWHGASWTFIAWGCFHGLFLVLERMFLSKVYLRIGSLLSTLFTFFTVMMGWVFFRAEDMQDARMYFQKLFSWDFKHYTIIYLNDFYALSGLAILISFSGVFKKAIRLQNALVVEKFSVLKLVAVAIICMILLVLSVSSIVSSTFNPFIYSRF